MAVYNNILDTIGGTPLVRLNRLTEGLGAEVLVKVESFNPANSVKDRIAKAIVDTAVESGELKPGGTIVEATSGNTGIGLALVGAAQGYKVILTMPETMSNERKVLLRAYGAEIVLTPGAAGMKGAVEKANEIIAETPNAILASQFANEANPKIHEATTGREIWDDAEGKVDAFVAGVGTGGTVTGVGRYLRSQNPDTYLVARASAPTLSPRFWTARSSTRCSPQPPRNPSPPPASWPPKKDCSSAFPPVPTSLRHSSWLRAKSSRARPSSSSPRTSVSAMSPPSSSRTFARPKENANVAFHGTSPSTAPW